MEQGRFVAANAKMNIKKNIRVALLKRLFRSNVQAVEECLISLNPESKMLDRISVAENATFLIREEAALRTRLLSGLMKEI